MGKYTQEQRKLFALNFFFSDRTFEHIAHYKPANRTKSDKMNVLLTFEEREKKMDKIEIKLRRYNCQSVQKKYRH